MSSLKDAIYETMVRPDAWTAALVGIAAYLDVKDLAISAYDLESRKDETISLPIDPDFAFSYATHWASRNFLWKASAKLPVGATFGFETFMPPASFARTELYGEWFGPQGMDRAMGVNLLAADPVSVTLVGYRPSSRAAFEPADTARLRRLFPHLQRAMQVRARLASAEGDVADFRATLAALDKPALLVDPHSRVLYANAPAEALFSGRLLMVSREGRLSAWSSDESNALHGLVFAAAQGAAGGKMVIRRPIGWPVTLLVSPLHRSQSVFAKSVSLILVDDPEPRVRAPPDVDLLAAAFHLTAAEAQLVVTLLQYGKLRAAAERLGITFATARTHLAHVFQKTQVSTQTELVRLLIKTGLGG